MSSLGRRLTLGAAILLVATLAVLTAVQLERPVPAPTTRSELASSVPFPGLPATLPWPAQGQGALYLSGFGWLGATSGETPVPIASVTKIMTALVILRTRPLQLGSAGPEVAVSPAAVALYQSLVSQGDSVVRVARGESLSEFQLLEGLLVPSGDNLAVLLADWQAGSEPTFVAEMNSLAQSLHLTQTHFADSSGLDPGSVSSARDLVALAMVAMAEPVFAAIVAMPSVLLPVAGTVRNYNPLLGQERVDGVKTGWTSASLGCLVFAAPDTVAGQTVQLVGAVLGQPGGPTSALQAAARTSLALLMASESELQRLVVPSRGIAVAQLRLAWAPEITLEVGARPHLVGPAGAAVRVGLTVGRLRAPLRSGSQVGYLTLTTPAGWRSRWAVFITRGLSSPSLWWRLTRPW
ncbi:MAG TPA: hypothetical protein VNH20_08285 [Candidatus Dormibacteraeota bacterium]|nr:hypothetical protein [Candidatus Dormibacteraeota bacterium]